ncbi:MAG: translocation/assembly module TamB [Bacteroidetes bacterium]|nr:translocation/assembly module TamB [Bacteroidota bacterium]
MANLDNNNDKENKNSISKKIQESLEKGKEQLSESLHEADDFAKDAIHHPLETTEAVVQQAAKDVTNVRWWARLLQILFWFFLTVFVSIFIIISLPITKNYAAKRVIEMLNKDLKSQISFHDVEVNYFGDVTIHQVQAKDYKNFPFIKIEKVYADSNWFSLIFNSRNIHFQSIALDKMDLKVITYKGDSISNFVRFVELFDDGKPRDPKRPPFELQSRMMLSQSSISIINQNSPGEAGKWLDAKNVHFTIPRFKVKGADIEAQINNLSFTAQRWGKKHYIDTFSGAFSYSKKALTIKDLTFNTDHSLLQGDIRFNINKGSWADFNNKVKMEINLEKGSQLSGYDLSYFVTQWDNFVPINISGKIIGPLNQLSFNHFVLGNSLFSLNTPSLQLKKITDPKNFNISSEKISTDFTYQDLKKALPSFIANKLKNFADDFGRMKYNGSLRVKPEEIFVNQGDIITGIGRAQVSNFYLRDYSGHTPKYKGNAIVHDLNTSVITKNKQVGLLSGNFNIDGQSFDVNTMVLKTQSEVKSIEILGKKIQNITINGALNHKKYLGDIQINDPQAQLQVNGLIDFSTPNLKADIDSKISHLQLNYFTNTATPQVISGSLKGKISMTNINDLHLETSIDHLSVYNGKDKILIPTSDIKIYNEGFNRIITVHAPSIAQGEIKGRFNLSDIGGMVQNGINKVLVGPQPRKIYKGQEFSANFFVEQNLINYFAPDIRIPQGAKIEAEYNGNTNDLVLNAQARSLHYAMTKTKEFTDAELELAQQNPNYKLTPTIEKDSITASGINLNINTKTYQDHIVAQVEELKIGENKLTEIDIHGENEDGRNLHVVTNFKMNNANVEGKKYQIAFDQTINQNGDLVFRFEPTEIDYKNVVWHIDTNHDLEHTITYKRASGEIDIRNLKIYSDDSEIILNHFNFKSSKEFEAEAQVSNLEISKVFKMIAKDTPMDIEGIANGNLHITRDKNAIKPLIDVDFERLKMNGREMGNMEINIENSDKPNIYTVSTQIKKAQLLGDNPLDVKGTIDNTGKKAILDLSADLKNFELAFANEFVKGIFSKMRGQANGILKITGPIDDIDYSGDIALKNFGLQLDFTGVDYNMDDCTISLSKGLAILNEIGVHDGRKNSNGTISGAIQFQTLSSMGVNLVMRAENLLMLNTTQKDFDLFWGMVYGQGTLFVDGPVAALNLSTPDMKALNNSVFTFNSSSAGSVDEFKLLRFLKTDQTGTISIEDKKKSGANMDINFNLAVDKGTTVNVLVGDGMGDISVRGNSNSLRFQMSRRGVVEMNGTYTVDNGTFISKEILNRTFQIEKGSNIRWDGEAMTPALDIRANYPRMVTNAGAYLGMSSIPPINVLLETKISGTLNNPDLNFGISALDVSSQVKEALATKMNQEDEKIIQFGSVLVLSNFNVQNSAFDAGNMGGFAESSGYNLLFKQLGSVLNTISNQVQFDLNYVKGDQASQIGDRANAGLNFNFSPRITLKTGMGIPINKNSATAAANYLSAEGTLEYDASENNDGSFIIRGYSKPSNIGMIGTNGITNGMANQSYGVGAVWTKSFNSLFKREKSKQKFNNKNNDKSHVPINDSIKKDSVK